MTKFDPLRLRMTQWRELAENHIAHHEPIRECWRCSYDRIQLRYAEILSDVPEECRDLVVQKAAELLRLEQVGPWEEA